MICFQGIQIASMPNFAHLSILSMDSFEPMPGFAFPSSIKSLDFAHRCDISFGLFNL